MRIINALIQFLLLALPGGLCLFVLFTPAQNLPLYRDIIISAGVALFVFTITGWFVSSACREAYLEELMDEQEDDQT